MKEYIVDHWIDPNPRRRGSVQFQLETGIHAHNNNCVRDSTDRLFLVVEKKMYEYITDVNLALVCPKVEANKDDHYEELMEKYSFHPKLISRKTLLAKIT